MTTITINEMGCGSGKTVNHIYPLIQNNISQCIPTMVVCISKNLQQQYKSKFPHMIVINTDNESDSCSSKVYETMENGCNLICITHQTFLYLDHNPFMKRYDLIMDEAIANPYNMFNIKRNKYSIPYELIFYPISKKQKDEFDVYYDMNEFNDTDFIELTHNGTYKNDDTIFSESMTYKQLISNNFKFYATYSNYKNMIDCEKNFIMFSVLDCNIFKRWNLVYIAAAKFENTYLHYMFDVDEIDYEIPSGLEFKRHNANLMFHTAKFNQDNGTPIKWSKKLQESDNGKAIKKQYHDYINKNSNGNILVLRNKNSNGNIENGYVEYELSHNVHGINKKEYVDCTNVSFEAAILPSGSLKYFISYVILQNVLDIKQKDKIINHLFYGYKFYQSLMRCKLRDINYNDELVNIYVMDFDVQLVLMDYFNIKSYDCLRFIDIDPIDQKKNGRPITSNADIAKEKARLRQQKRRKLQKENSVTPRI